MSITVSKTPLFEGNDPIKFSELSSTFKNGTQSNIKFSEYKRNTDREVENPIVPDATENESIAAVENNLKISSYRGSIKSYDITQSGTDATLDLGLESNWNGNLNRNIIKKASITGICHATSTSNYGVKLDAETYNLDIDISGAIYGEGGTPGAPGRSTITGGSESQISNTTTYSLISVTRYFNPSTGDHYSTTTQGTAAPSGYIPEGTLCSVYSTQAPGTIPIFNADGAGRPNSGIMGYAYERSSPPSVPYITIYALSNGSDTMWSTQTSEGSYTLLRTEFYAPTQALSIVTTSTIINPGVVETTQPTTSSDGGGALYVRNTTTRTSDSATIDIRLNSNAKVWAGGGAGESGSAGQSGPRLSCNSTSSVNRSVSTGGGGSRNCPGNPCPSGYKKKSCNPTDTRKRCRGSSPRRGESGYVCAGNWSVRCTRNTSFNTQGSGGNGGAGGPGRGYSTLNNSIAGASGNSGSSANCNGGTSTGSAGNSGSSGGEWGEPGGGTSGGKKGIAIVGAKYKISGSSTNNLKGGTQTI